MEMTQRSKKEKDILKLGSRTRLSIKCLHKYEVKDDYIGKTFFGHKKVILMRCKYCGNQFIDYLPLKI